MSAAVSRSVPESGAVRRTLRGAMAGLWPLTLGSLRVLTGIAVTFLLLLFGPAAAHAAPQPGAVPAVAQQAGGPQAAEATIHQGSAAGGTAATTSVDADDANTSSFCGFAAPRPGDTGETTAPQRPRSAPADENAESRGCAALGERAPPGR